MTEKNEKCRLEKAVDAAARNWPAASGDTNLVDIHWLARTIREELGVALPTEFPSNKIGVQAFECVETNLLRDVGNKVLRDTPRAELVRRIEGLPAALKGILPFTDEQNLVVSLYAWHGCIHMAKVLRCTRVIPGGQALYTPQMRRDGYEHIKADWTQEESQGNPWVRFGVSLTRRMEQGRKKENFDFEVHENWVPDDSPYWESEDGGAS
ncbi:MAG: hypothetical protein ACLQIB_02700 [Isosphaeraceae bacterium]